MAMLLLHASATVTVCHSQTRDLAAHTRRADILVAAIGRPRFVNGGHDQAGRRGDRRRHQSPRGGQAASCAATSISTPPRRSPSLITPVPGGVGPMTITMLLANTIEGAERVGGQEGLVGAMRATRGSLLCGHFRRFRRHSAEVCEP